MSTITRNATRFSILVFVVGLFAIRPSVAPAGPDGSTKKTDKSIEIFNGKDLTGWTVTGCEAEVVDGAILIKSGNGLVQTEKQYADFVLEIDWKALKPKDYDSGIYFRYTKVPRPKRPWPLRYQANMLRGQEGNVNGIEGAVSKGLIKKGWNKFKLTVIGSKAKLEINGKPAWEADGIEDPKGYIGLQAEVPKGGQFLFRNIRIGMPK